MTKEAIRKNIIKRRLSLKNAEIKRQGKKVFNNFLLAGLPTGINVLLYLPIKNEVDTKEFLEFYLKCGTNIFLPKYEKNNWGISRLTSYSDLEKGPFGTQQSKESLEKKVVIDLAIVPGIAFCPSGVRVGFGKGIYDMILSKFKTFVVGLCYDFQIVDGIKKETHDVLVDMIISDARILKITYE